MAFFRKKEESAKADVSGSKERKLAVKDEREIKYVAGAIIKPRVTEKVTNLAAQGVYVFDVRIDANKIEVAKSIEKMYKVKPVKVRIIKVPSKKVYSRGRVGVKSGGKKAYIYLKKGESINVG